MKLISFNILGGTIYGPLMDYLRKLSADTDIFCFQEVFSALPGAPEVSSGARMFLFNELARLLPEFSGFFDPRHAGYDFSGAVDFPVSHGLAVFVRRNLSVASYRSEIVEQATVDDSNPLEGWIKAQVLEIDYQEKKFSVINFHGVALPGDKQDTPQRISHMKKLRLIWDSLAGSAKILCGDFNLYPETESIRILETASRNLIKEFNITNTRNEITWEKYHNRQTFADFTFVSENVKVKSFEVPYTLASDHLPMVLDFRL